MTEQSETHSMSDEQKKKKKKKNRRGKKNVKKGEEERKEGRRSALTNLFILFVVGASGVVTAFIAPAFGGIGWQLVGGIALWMTLFAVLMLASHLVMYLLGAGVYD